MNVKQPIPITNIEQLMKSYPTSFDTLGQFKGDYHVVLKPDSQPVVRATRKCRIQMRNEIKQTVYDMENNGNIRKVTEPTPWVSSLTYPRKSNGKLPSPPSYSWDENYKPVYHPTGDLITTQHPTTGRWNRASIVDVCEHPHSYIIETEGGAQYHRNRRHPDPIPATEYETHTLPRAPEATCTKSGRVSKPPARYSNWT